MQKSPLVTITKKQKEEALQAVRNGLQQLTWQHGYYVSQIDALPELGENATIEEKQNRAKMRVQADAMEKKIEEQQTFYKYCADNI